MLIGSETRRAMTNLHRQSSLLTVHYGCIRSDGALAVVGDRGAGGVLPAGRHPRGVRSGLLPAPVQVH